MKYGIVIHKNTQNIGDVIQAYAASRLLPQVDYCIDRENMNSFESEDNEQVAVIMGAWFMWKKWHWPPASCIVPHFAGFHYTDHQVAKQPKGSPIKTEFLTGLGREYMNSNGPVGCRDYFTRDQLKKLGIDAYFSGCVTLTLPKMPIIEKSREYICLVEMPEEVEKRVRMLLEGKDIDIVTTSHIGYKDPKATWPEWKKKVEDLLTLYQNSKCVLTFRLHAALPCLAMEVPVLLLADFRATHHRFQPYSKWMHGSTVKEFVNGDYDYFIYNPPTNPTNYLECRNQMIQSVQGFIKNVHDETQIPNWLERTGHTELDLLKWQNHVMEQSLNLWLADNRNKAAKIAVMSVELNTLRKEHDKIYNLKIIKKKYKRITSSKIFRLSMHAKKCIRQIQNTLIDCINRLKIRVYNLRGEGSPAYKQYEYFSESWMKRIEIAAKMISDEDKTILDLGCGKMWLKQYLAPDKIYYGSDYTKRDSDTILCDFNKMQFPQIKVDVCFVSGCMEYIENWKWFLGKISKCSHCLILTYVTADNISDLNKRTKRTWVNHITENELLEYIASLGFSLRDKNKYKNNQIYKFVKL